MTNKNVFSVQIPVNEAFLYTKGQINPLKQKSVVFSFIALDSNKTYNIM